MSFNIEELNKRIYNSLQITNDINALYCDAFDRFYNQKVGERFDFSNLNAELAVLLLKATSDSISAREIKEQYYSYYQQNMNYLEVVKLLVSYQELLARRISLLCEISGKLANKALGIRPKYSYFAYKSDTKKLGKLEQEALSVGDKLQAFAEPFMLVVRNGL